jgi:REP element-mobilizing transposase RayT
MPGYGAPQGSQSLKQLAERNAISRSTIATLKKLSFDKFIDDQYGDLVEVEALQMMQNHLHTLSAAEQRKLSNKIYADRAAAHFLIQIEPVLDSRVRDWFRRDYPTTPWGEVPSTQNSLYFKGFPCRIDCSGHLAGYEWAANNNLNSDYECDQRISIVNQVQSPSFYEGCLAFTREY